MLIFAALLITMPADFRLESQALADDNYIAHTVSPDGRYLLLAASQTLHLMDLQSGMVVRQIVVGSDNRTAIFAPDSKTIAYTRRPAVFLESRYQRRARS